MANLLEQYKNRLAISENVYRTNHNGARMSDTKKLATAVCLNNIDKFLNESFQNSTGTNVDSVGTANLGLWKKFCL